MIAKKTLAAINRALAEDQGVAYRRLLAKYIPLAADVYRGAESPFRSHLGASGLGRECAREIWYSFRWATWKQINGRVLRLFNRGHLEEPRILALLEMIGCEVWATTDDGKQIRVKEGYAGGSLDAIIRGIPECADTKLLAEFKTHSEKSFLRVAEDGVMSSKWEHFIQMQYYMGMAKLEGALYVAVNKNTDDLYCELVAFDPVQFQRARERATMIANAQEAPPRISNDPSWYKCKFCDHHDICHGARLPVKTCRSCINVVQSEGGWHCTAKGITLTRETQELGCEQYVLNDSFKSNP